MVACAWCEQEMTETVSCTLAAWHRDGVPIARRAHAGCFVGTRCGDCGTPPGGIHHPGCCAERCPVCRGQAMTCGCRFDEDGPDDEDRHLDAAIDAYHDELEAEAACRYDAELEREAEEELRLEEEHGDEVEVPPEVLAQIDAMFDRPRDDS